VSDDAPPQGPLWRYFREVRDAVERANRGDGDQPYRPGDFLVRAEVGEIELTVRDVSEEDAVLIAGELATLGARTAIRALRTCPSCGQRVPAQAYCVHCRAPLGDPA
jgi:hypothetical protein